MGRIVGSAQTPEYYQGKLDELNQNLLSLESTERVTNKEIGLADSVIEAIGEYEDILSSSLSGLGNQLTAVLSEVYPDRNFEVVLKVSKNSIDFYLIENGIEVEFESTGHGIISIVDTFLRVFMIQAFGYNKILFLDEAFSFVNSDRLPQVLAVLEREAVQQGFRIVYITPAQGSFEADFTYKFIRKGTYTEVEVG